MNENLQMFIEANKNKVIVRRNSQGEIIGIESLVPSTELNFYKTNCKIDKVGSKFILSTIDGEQFRFDFKMEDLDRLNSLLKSKIFKHKKLQSSKKYIGLGTFIKSIPSKFKNINFGSNKPVEHLPNPLGNYNVHRVETEKLITKINSMFEKISNDSKYKNDIEINNYKKRFTELIERYKSAIEMKDTSEMLNVKTKLVSLSGYILVKEKQLQNIEQSTEEMLESIPDETEKSNDLNNEEKSSDSNKFEERMKNIYRRSVETAYTISKIFDDNKDIDFSEEKDELATLTRELQNISAKTKELQEIKENDIIPFIELSRKLSGLNNNVEEKLRKIRSIYKESKNEPGSIEDNNTQTKSTTETLNLVEEKADTIEESGVPKLPAQSSIDKIETVSIPSITSVPTQEVKPISTVEENKVIEQNVEKIDGIEPSIEKVTPEITTESLEIARDEERKKQINSDIEKSNKKISDIEENIKYFEHRIKQTEESIRTSNLDSMEINSYNKVKQNYQEKLNNQRVLLEQAKEELKQNISRLTAFMNEEVTYYLDGKPYKKATRKEIEKYKQQQITDEKIKKDYARQKVLLEERKELERKLKENYEALKSLSTFDDDMILPKEEPSIEEVQETVRRFHQ